MTERQKEEPKQKSSFELDEEVRLASTHAEAAFLRDSRDSAEEEEYQRSKSRDQQ